MKLFASVAFTLLVMATSSSYAEQTLSPTQRNDHDSMIMPSNNDQSPFDLNHMSTGSDKSDELGVPYYNDEHH